jgi:choline dehydrogenase-like flavoprotein
MTASSAHHLMGATRMHNDPKQGVVDENCKVHGVSNLFIASSSVFPTGGQVNPTLTIVALSVRLADHVKQVMASNVAMAE